MCLYIETKEDVHKAEQPIVCYKKVIVKLNPDGSTYLEARYRCFLYKLGHFYTEKRFEMLKERLALDSLCEQYEVNYGFHSYVSEEDAKKYDRGLDGYALLRCEIPANSHYYMGVTFNGAKSYCSKSIRITGLKLCNKNGIWDSEWMEPGVMSKPGPLKRLLIRLGIVKI